MVLVALSVLWARMFVSVLKVLSGSDGSKVFVGSDGSDYPKVLVYFCFFLI